MLHRVLTISTERYKEAAPLKVKGLLYGCLLITCLPSGSRTHWHLERLCEEPFFGCVSSVQEAHIRSRVTPYGLIWNQSKNPPRKPNLPPLHSFNCGIVIATTLMFPPEQREKKITVLRGFWKDLTAIRIEKSRAVDLCIFLGPHNQQ